MCKKEFSNPEQIIKEKLDSLFLKQGIDYIPHCSDIISPFELDFFFPFCKFAIEVSPSFTHCLKKVSISYHYNKYKKCFEKGIELFTLFDYHNIEVVFRIIKEKLFKKTFLIHFKNLDFKIGKTLNNKLKNFIEEHNYIKSIPFFTDYVEIKWGKLIVGVVLFQKISNFSYMIKDFYIMFNANKVEVLEKCFDFLKSKKKLLKSLVAYSDNTIGNSCYQNLGFSMDCESEGNIVWYSKTEDRIINDLTLSKKLKILNKYTTDKFEKYIPIPDCGRKRWVKRLGE